MSAARRYLSRPRTKLYDYNYAMGERMYRGMVDSLDKPRGSRNLDSAPSTPTSTYTSSAKSSLPPPGPSSSQWRHASLERDASEEDDTIRKIRAARAKMEEEVRTFEEGSNARRAALRNGSSSSSNRVDMSERLLESVGVRKSTENGDYDFAANARSRRAVTELEEDPFFTKRTFKPKYQLEDEDEAPLPRLKSKARANGHSALESSEESSFDTAAALARAKKSRARLAEIDDEMEALAQRSKARGARMASAQAVLREAAECDSSVATSQQQTVRVKRSIQVTERVG